MANQARISKWALFFLVVCLLGCGPIEHDQPTAVNRALEFADIVFIRQNFDKGYDGMSGKAKAYIPVDVFKNAMLSLHPDGYPKTIKATGYRPYAEYEKVEVALHGDNAGRSFDYVLTLLGSAKKDYKVTIVRRSGFASSMGGSE